MQSNPSSPESVQENDFMITVLIVDGEPLVRAHIARMLGARPGFRVVGEMNHAAGAVEAARRLRPDIVILDQDLADFDSFDPGVLQERDPASVLILTAAQGEATPPLRLHAFDHLPKPFDDQRFDRVLERAAAYLGQGDHWKGQHLRLLAAYPQEEEATHGTSPPRRYADRLLVRDGDRVRFLKVDDIDRIEVRSGIVRVYAAGRAHCLAESLDDLARRLDPRQFFSVHRSLLVNVDRLEPLKAVR